jgi:hypothetical protein
MTASMPCVAGRLMETNQQKWKLLKPRSIQYYTLYFQPDETIMEI